MTRGGFALLGLRAQLAVALNGAADHVWAVSFIVTNIPADPGDLVGLDAHVHRGRVP